MTDHTALTAALARCAAALGHPAEVTFRTHHGYLYARLGRWESSPGVSCAKTSAPEVRAYAERESLRLLADEMERATRHASAGVRGAHGERARARSHCEATAQRLAAAERVYLAAKAAHEAATSDLHAAEAAYDTAASEHPEAALAQSARDELDRAMRGER